MSRATENPTYVFNPAIESEQLAGHITWLGSEIRGRMAAGVSSPALQNELIKSQLDQERLKIEIESIKNAPVREEYVSRIVHRPKGCVTPNDVADYLQSIVNGSATDESFKQRVADSENQVKKNDIFEVIDDVDDEPVSEWQRRIRDMDTNISDTRRARLAAPVKKDEPNEEPKPEDDEPVIGSTGPAGRPYSGRRVVSGPSTGRRVATGPRTRSGNRLANGVLGAALLTAVGVGGYLVGKTAGWFGWGSDNATPVASASPEPGQTDPNGDRPGLDPVPTATQEPTHTPTSIPTPVPDLTKPETYMNQGAIYENCDDVLVDVRRDANLSDALKREGLSQSALFDVICKEPEKYREWQKQNPSKFPDFNRMYYIIGGALNAAGVQHWENPTNGSILKFSKDDMYFKLSYGGKDFLVKVTCGNLVPEVTIVTLPPVKPTVRPTQTPTSTPTPTEMTVETEEEATPTPTSTPTPRPGGGGGGGGSQPGSTATPVGPTAGPTETVVIVSPTGTPILTVEVPTPTPAPTNTETLPTFTPGATSTLVPTRTPGGPTPTAVGTLSPTVEVPTPTPAPTNTETLPTRTVGPTSTLVPTRTPGGVTPTAVGTLTGGAPTAGATSGVPGVPTAVGAGR